MRRFGHYLHVYSYWNLLRFPGHYVAHFWSAVDSVWYDYNDVGQGNGFGTNDDAYEEEVLSRERVPADDAEAAIG